MTMAHRTVTLERSIDATPERVFHFWRDPAERAIWGAPFDGVTLTYEAVDFRPGGHEICQCTMADGGAFTVATRYYDIAENARLVFTETLLGEGTTWGVSLVSVGFDAVEAGCHMRVTIQAVGLDGSGFETELEGGWSHALDILQKRAEAVAA